MFLLALMVNSCHLFTEVEKLFFPRDSIVVYCMGCNVIADPRVVFFADTFLCRYQPSHAFAWDVQLVSDLLSIQDTSVHPREF